MTPLTVTSVAAAALSLLLSLWLFVANESAKGLQARLQDRQKDLQDAQAAVQAQQQRIQTQQEQINVGNALAQQVGPQVVQALGQAVVTNKNEKIRGLLKKHGIDVQEKKDGAAPPAEKPAASTPAP